LILDEADACFRLGFAAALKLIHKPRITETPDHDVLSTSTCELNYLTKLCSKHHKDQCGSSGEKSIPDIPQAFYLADDVTHKRNTVYKIIAEKTIVQNHYFYRDRRTLSVYHAALNEQGMHSIALRET